MSGMLVAHRDRGELAIPNMPGTATLGRCLWPASSPVVEEFVSGLPDSLWGQDPQESVLLAPSPTEDFVSHKGLG